MGNATIAMRLGLLLALGGMMMFSPHLALGDEPTGKIPQTQPSATRAQLVAQARETFEALDDRLKNGEPLNPAYMELYCTWSRRWAEAQCDAAATAAERIAAVKAYLNRLPPVMTDERPGSVWHLVSAMRAYHEAQGKQWLAREQAAATAPADTKAAKLVEQAGVVVDQLVDLVNNGEPLTFGFFELHATWSRRLAEAECDLAKTAASRVAAVQAHLERMQRMREIAVGKGRTRIQISMTEYYCVEAERWLSREKNAPTTRPAASALKLTEYANLVVDELSDLRSNGQPLTIPFVELSCAWSQRLARAQCDAVTTGDQRIAAVKGHAERTVYQGIIFDGGGGVWLANGVVNYYHAEALQWLAREKNVRPTKTTC